jgi:hypothetical protein
LGKCRSASDPRCRGQWRSFVAVASGGEAEIDDLARIGVPPELPPHSDLRDREQARQVEEHLWNLPADLIEHVFD